MSIDAEKISPPWRQKWGILYRDQRLRFLAVGALNTAVGYGLFAFFVFVGLHYLMAQLVASILAIAHSYIWNKYFTFQSPGHSLPEMLRFLGVYAVSYALNVALLFACVEWAHLNPYLAGVVGLFVTTAISYLGHRKFSFR